MAVVTIGRLAEECLKLISGGDIPLASGVSLNEMKISVGQVANTLLKTDYIKVNGKTGETIPNGAVIAYYPAIIVEKWKNKSRARLPIKPLMLPRDMGVWSVFPSDYPEKEIIPLQMGQWSLLQSQPMINDLLGQTGRETYGDYVVFSKDLTIPGEDVTVDMRLVVMDISLYGDFDPLPLLPEHEWQIKQAVVQMYSQEVVPDKVVDSTQKERKGIPVNEQRQS